MAGALSLRMEAISRGARMLRTALGPAIATWLEDPAVVEVMLNPDGRLWVDRLTEGLADTGERLSAADGERIVRLVAHHVGAEVHPASPRVSAELPETGEPDRHRNRTFLRYAMSGGLNFSVMPRGGGASRIHRECSEIMLVRCYWIIRFRG